MRHRADDDIITRTPVHDVLVAVVRGYRVRQHERMCAPCATLAFAMHRISEITSFMDNPNIADMSDNFPQPELRP